jgi:pimeloyl-ACP methyl ester carboxylesterase
VAVDANALSGSDLEIEVVGEGPSVLFVHGSVVGPDRTWAQQLALADEWTLRLPSRPGFGASPPLERGDFELEAPLFAELLGEGAHLVGHSYGAVIALHVAALRPGAVRSLTISEPGCLAVARDDPAVARMIEGGRRLYGARDAVSAEAFLRLFREGANSARQTPEELPDWLRRGAELLVAERPPWEGDVPLERLERAGLPTLVISGGHSEAFEAVCDAIAARLGAERAVIPGRGHTVPATGAPYNARLREFLQRSGS